jgi:hypothetical protein
VKIAEGHLPQKHKLVIDNLIELTDHTTSSK